jgi:hypothetical protein
MLESFTYMSSAVHLPSQAEIEYLLDRARMRNARESVTGVLLYSEGCFLQCLEGEKEAIDLVYGHILRDPLHHNIFELLRDSILDREFGDWHMAFRSTSTHLAPTSDLDQLEARLAAPEGVLSPARHLLSAFWNGGMGSRYQAAHSGRGSRG